jgi:hypothetical protein
MRNMVQRRAQPPPVVVGTGALGVAEAALAASANVARSVVAGWLSPAAGERAPVAVPAPVPAAGAGAGAGRPGLGHIGAGRAPTAPQQALRTQLQRDRGRQRKAHADTNDHAAAPTLKHAQSHAGKASVRQPGPAVPPRKHKETNGDDDGESRTRAVLQVCLHVRVHVCVSLTPAPPSPRQPKAAAGAAGGTAATTAAGLSKSARRRLKQRHKAAAALGVRGVPEVPVAAAVPTAVRAALARPQRRDDDEGGGGWLSNWAGGDAAAPVGGANDGNDDDEGGSRIRVLPLDLTVSAGFQGLLPGAEAGGDAGNSNDDSGTAAAGMRSRTKKRSRQKNIRKDTRPPELVRTDTTQGQPRPWRATHTARSQRPPHLRDAGQQRVRPPVG